MIIGDQYIFVENPKTACTSIRMLLEEKGGKQHGMKHWNLRDFQSTPRRKFRFVFVRNPWDRMVSGFYFQTGGKMDFKKWVLGVPWVVAAGIDFKRTPQAFWAYQCNTILRFENLHEHLGVILPRVGIDEWELKHTHKSKGRTDYKDYYDDETREVVADRFRTDITEFGYRFD